jgi:kinesin family member 1
MKSTANPRSSVRDLQDEHSMVSTNGGDDNSRVRVVVRIRPLNDKEMSNNHKNILEGGHHHIVAWDPTCFEQANKPDMSILDSSCWSREFAFDRCLWSTDLKSPEYASQSDVFEEVGKPVLDWILGGFNCCVFAFGQTGAGEFYMIRYYSWDRCVHGRISCVTPISNTSIL